VVGERELAEGIAMKEVVKLEEASFREPLSL